MKKILMLLIFLGIIFAGSALIFLPPYLSASMNPEPVDITVPEGASLSYVSNELYEKGIIKNKTWFNHKAKESGVDRKIKPGSYSIPANVTLEDIFSLLISGIPDKQLVLTIPEGFTLFQIAERVESLGFGSRDEFIEATEKYFQEKNYDFNTEDLFFSMEGYLYPDTYHFNERQTIDDIVETLAKTTEDIFTEEYRQKAAEMGLSIHEILTIASLIEREAINDVERPTIAGVIYNRLEIEMLLQIDASVIYGTGKGVSHSSDIYKSDLEKVAPFNTYTVKGLPPGPIASPSKISIEAALYPEEHDFFYYVLNSSGDKHVFSKTFAEHEVNVQKYRNRNK